MAGFQPFRLQIGTMDVYLGPVGEADPGADVATPAGNWLTIGQADGPVTFAPNKATMNLFDNSSLGPLKVATTAFEPTVAFTLANMTLEKVAEFYSDITVTDAAAGGGTKGYRHYSVGEPDDDQWAMILQNITASPYMSDLFRILIYAVSVKELGEQAWTKEDKTVQPVTMQILKDPSTGNFYKVYAVDAAAA